MYRPLAAELCAGKLAAPVRDDLVDIHVELSAAAGHPDVHRKHVVMIPGDNLIADVRDQLEGGSLKSAARMVGHGGRAFQYRVGGDHLARHQVAADTEMLE